MAQTEVSSKRVQIEQSMSTMVKIAAVALFVTIFCLLSAHALWNKLAFQNRVISAKTTARNRLRADVTAASSLNKSYQRFNGSNTNLLGAQVTGPDNDNAKTILDALPSSYDYPALTTSVQDLLSNQGVNIDSIGGTDESGAAASSNGTTVAPTSPGTITTHPIGQTIAMPFTFTVDGPYQNLQNIVNTFEKSIRPFQFQTLVFSGDQTDVNLSVTAQTFYQPATSFKITTEKVQ